MMPGRPIENRKPSLAVKIVLAIYPHEWRARYQEEMLCLAQDVYGPTFPLSCVAGMAKDGLRQRLSSMGILSENPLIGDPRSQMVHGGVLSVWAFALVVLAGSGFAKFIEHWNASISQTDSFLPRIGAGIVNAAAVAGAVMVAGGLAVLARPALRFVREGGWAAIKRKFITVTCLGAGTLAWLAFMVKTAHSLPAQARNGGSVSYLEMGLLFVVLTTLSIFSLASLVSTLARGIELSDARSKACGWMSVMLGGSAYLFAVGLAIWWSSMLVRAPWFFGGTRAQPSAALAPQTLVGIAVLTLAAVLVASKSTKRILVSFMRWE